MSREVEIDRALFKESLAVAKELVRGHRENPERHRIVVGLATVLYRESRSVLTPEDVHS